MIIRAMFECCDQVAADGASAPCADSALLSMCYQVTVTFVCLADQVQP
jgi:hypothetical protein